MFPRAVFGLATALALLAAAPTARATGAALPPSGSADPSTLDVAIAVAPTPLGSTRWARLTVAGPNHVMWLVPARPGASLDWASDAWLSALDTATAPRIAPPSAEPPCGQSTVAERVPTWGGVAGKKFPRAVVAHASEGDLRNHVASRGFEISGAASTSIGELYGQGYGFVSIEIETSGAISSPTLRVHDDAPAVLPLALTGSRATTTRLTAVVIAGGGATLSGAREVDPDLLSWGPAGSTYANERARILANGGGAIWLRESSSAQALFTGSPVPRGAPIPSVVSAYFRDATGQITPACEAAAKAAAAEAGVVGRACPAGALARLPGGVECVPDPGAIDPSKLTCGSGVDDLALALAGAAPRSVHVSRLSGIVPRGSLGFEWTIHTPSAAVSPVGFAGRFEACPPPATSPPSNGSISPSSPSDDEEGGGGHVLRETGCMGSATTVVYETGEEAVVADEGCSGGTTGTTTTAGEDGCGGDTTGSSSGSSSDDDDSDGWDTADDDDGDSSDDACSSKKSSSSSSSSSSGSSSGWDEPDMSPQSTGAPIEPSKTSKKKSGKQSMKKVRGSSPVSRYAMLFVAIVLPLRRRLRWRELRF
ncbi:MAG: hypothetical protein KF819_35430 [Labilithrix sp.]|nr:hypothetical protein [Labilithrix sp.]